MAGSEIAIWVKSSRYPWIAGTHTPRPLDFARWTLIPAVIANAGGYWVPAFAGTTRGKSIGPSNLPAEILLHPVGHLDQPPPRPLAETTSRGPCRGRSAAESRSCALALGDLRLGFPQRIRLRQRLIDLAGDGRLALRQLPLQLFILGLQPADFRVKRGAFVGHRIAGPAGGGVVAGRNSAGPWYRA